MQNTNIILYLIFYCSYIYCTGFTTNTSKAYLYSKIDEMEIRIAIAAVIIFACVNSLDSSKRQYLSDKEFCVNILSNIL